MNNHWFLKFIIITALLSTSCVKKEITILTNEEKNAKILDETEIINIQLAGEVSIRKSEISGLCWYNSNLILLPQYPDRFSNEAGGKIFFIPKERIKSYLSGKNKSPIDADYYSINVNDFPNLFSIGLNAKPLYNTSSQIPGVSAINMNCLNIESSFRASSTPTIVGTSGTKSIINN